MCGTTAFSFVYDIPGGLGLFGPFERRRHRACSGEGYLGKALYSRSNPSSLFAVSETFASYDGVTSTTTERQQLLLDRLSSITLFPRIQPHLVGTAESSATQGTAARTPGHVQTAPVQQAEQRQFNPHCADAVAQP